jgi:hypothetical protein
MGRPLPLAVSLSHPSRSDAEATFHIFDRSWAEHGRRRVIVTTVLVVSISDSYRSSVTEDHTAAALWIQGLGLTRAGSPATVPVARLASPHGRNPHKKVAIQTLARASQFKASHKGS